MVDELQQGGRLSARARHAALGIIALAIAAGSLYLTWFFLQGGLEGGVPVKAFFSAPGIGQQLPEGGDVKIRGVLVGRIADTSVTGDEAVIELRLDSDAEISADSVAEIRSKTIFGQKWIELIPPSAPSNEEILVAGSEIPDARTIEPLEFERALQLGHDLISEIPLNDLASVTRALADAFTGQEEEARTAIDRGLEALRAVNSRSAEFDLALRQLSEFSAWLADNDESLLSFFGALDSANRALVGAAPEFIASNRSVPVFLDDLASFQERIDSDLGRLVEDGADVLELVAARSDRLGSLVRGLQAFTTVWNSGLSQPCSGEFESKLTCWQVYLMPGLDSRGLYKKGQSPLDNEPGDPQRRFTATAEIADLLSARTGATPSVDLMEILLSGARRWLPEFWSAD